MASSSNYRKHIWRIGRIINIVCIVGYVVLGVLTAFSIVGIALIYLNPDMARYFVSVAEGTTFAQVFDFFLERDLIPSREINAINLFSFALSQITMLIFLVIGEITTIPQLVSQLLLMLLSLDTSLLPTLNIFSRNESMSDTC